VERHRIKGGRVCLPGRLGPKHTIYAWKQKYGGMEVAEAQELRHLRDENAKLKKLVAEYALDKEALKSVIAKNGYSS
jgi:putative transposase